MCHRIRLLNKSPNLRPVKARTHRTLRLWASGALSGEWDLKSRCMHLGQTLFIVGRQMKSLHLTMDPWSFFCGIYGFFEVKGIRMNN